MPDLPVDIDATYPDDPDRPSRKLHQQHHDAIHAYLDVVEDALPTKADVTALSVIDLGWVTTTSHGATCDARTVADVATTAGSPIITSATAAFTAADVGKVASLRTNATGVTTTILSVGDATQATLAANVPTTKAGAILTFGTDDTAAIQEAIDACPVGGTVYQPGESVITAALSVTKSFVLRGRGVVEVTDGIINSGYGSGPSVAPYLRGSVFVQATAGANGFDITATGVNFHAHDVAVRFAPHIMFLNTGHGFYAMPSALYGPGGHENGLFNPRWDTLNVFGHDGDHYAYYIFNCNLGTFTHLRAHGGGGLNLESDSYGAPFGNSVFVHPFFHMYAGGTADGFRLKARLIAANASLNLLSFLRPQCNILQPTLHPNFASLGIPAPTIAQYLWRTVGPDYPHYVDVIDPDLENDGTNLYPIDFGGMNSGTIVRKGGIITGTPVGGYSTENRAVPGVALQPTWVMGTGAGTGATAQILQGDDQSGLLLINMGTTPAAGGSTLITLTCPSMPSTGIKAVLIQGYAAGGIANKHFYAFGIALNSKSFEIRCSETLPGSPQQVQLMFQVIPRPAGANTATF